MSLTRKPMWRYVAGIILTAMVLFLVWYFSSVVIYILVSAVLAIIFRPMVRYITSIKVGKRRVPRWFAAFVTLMTIWVAFIAAFSLFVPLVANKVYELSTLDFGSVLKSIEEPIARAQDYLHSMFVMPDTKFSLTEVLANSLRDIIDYETINTAFSSVIHVGMSFVIAFFSISFITFFFLKEDGLFYAMVKAVFPERYQDNVSRALDKVTVLLSRYFSGLLAESVIIMIIISVVMIIFGMRVEDAFFIGLIMGIMNVIPYAGPVMGGIASVFIGIVTPISGYTVGTTMLIIAMTLLTVKGLDDFVLQPTLYSSRVKAHPLEVFLVILIAGSAAGVVGMLLAIPAYTVLRVFAKEFFSQFSLVKKLTENV
ncbi:MAG: AI-2E family transporter [Rikenellaceae bacterium]|nr:AI-2E family transporter [Rikenellaceae bacterium]MBQ7342061.1 AI-2E family transporter [Alistipes sp.]